MLPGGSSGRSPVRGQAGAFKQWMKSAARPHGGHQPVGYALTRAHSLPGWTRALVGGLADRVRRPCGACIERPAAGCFLPNLTVVYDGVFGRWHAPCLNMAIHRGFGRNLELSLEKSHSLLVHRAQRTQEVIARRAATHAAHVSHASTYSHRVF